MYDQQISTYLHYFSYKNVFTLSFGETLFFPFKELFEPVKLLFLPFNELDEPFELLFFAFNEILDPCELCLRRTSFGEDITVVSSF